MKKILMLLMTAVLLVAAVGCSTAASTPEDTGKKAILVVSFGTSYADTRELTIDATEAKYAETYPDYEVVRAFTAQIVIDVLEERDNIDVMNVEEAFKYLKDNKFSDVIVQPTLVMNGAEYDEMLAVVEEQEENFAHITVGAPLLTHVEDYMKVAEALRDEVEAAVTAEDEAVVLMGHGTHHYANSTYAAMEYTFHDLGMKNVFVGTVEGYPMIDSVIARLNENNIKKVTLYPFMLVAGDHASNDMAGDEEDAWKTILKKEGFEVETVLRGLGEDEAIQAIYLEHTEAAMAGEAH
jgi:sirohydrochlorin cobaltochelatase